MLRPLNYLINQFSRKSKTERELIAGFRNIVGSPPRNIKLYELALTHASNSEENDIGYRESNERLEFLGDAILDSIIADFLFRKYPFKDEGFLTELRSKIVSRESLNKLALTLGVPQLLKLKNRKLHKQSYKSLFGNALEAIIGAIYLDRGYDFCYKFVIKRLLIPYFDMDEIIATTTNFKSKLIEWGQKENYDVKFEIIEIKEINNYKEFTAQVFIDEKPAELGFGFNKKKAEQNAAFETLKTLKVE